MKNANVAATLALAYSSLISASPIGTSLMKGVGQVQIGILTHIPNIISDKPSTQPIRIPLGSDGSGGATFEPINFIGAVLSSTTHPVECAFYLSDGTQAGGIISNTNKYFKPNRQLNGVSEIKCNAIQAAVDNASPRTSFSDEALSVGKQLGIPAVLPPDIRENAQWGSSSSPSSGTSTFGDEDRQPELSNGQTAQLLQEGRPQRLPTSQGGIDSSDVIQSYSKKDTITYLIAQGIKGKERIEVPLTTQDGALKTGHVLWDEGQAVENILQSVWYDGPRNAVCRLIGPGEFGASLQEVTSAPKQFKGVQLSNSGDGSLPVPSIGVQCWSFGETIYDGLLVD